jgi:hypothetical protein
MAGKKRRGDNIHETPDVSYISNPDVSHETSDVSVGPILKFVLGLLVFAVIVHVSMWLLFRYLDKREQAAEREASPLARRGDERLPPEPRLQLAPGFGVNTDNNRRVNLSNDIEDKPTQPQPQSEYWTVRAEWDRKLHNYGWADETARTVQIPVEQAMQKYLERQQQKTQGQPAAATPQGAPAPGNRAEGESVPAQSSSGRVEEKRNQ